MKNTHTHTRKKTPLVVQIQQPCKMYLSILCNSFEICCRSFVEVVLLSLGIKMNKAKITSF